MDNTILNLIAKNKIEEAFQLIFEIAKSDEEKRIVSLIQANFIALENEKLKGTIHYDRYSIYRNQLIDKLMMVLNQLETPGNLNENFSIEIDFNPPKTQQNVHGNNNIISGEGDINITYN